MQIPRHAGLFLALMALHLAPATAVAGPGDLDPSFGAGGIVAVDVYARTGMHAVLDPEGRTLLTGDRTDSMAFVTRLDAAGAIDPTFGSDGSWSQWMQGPPQAKAITVLPGGRIVMVGSIEYDGLVVVLSPEGELVKVHRIDHGGTEVARAVAAGPGGTVLVAGSTSVGEHGDAVVWRLDPAEGLDPGFDADGAAGLDVGATEVAGALAVLDDGRIVVGGASSGEAVVWRLKPDGDPANVPNSALDPTFDGDGAAILHDDFHQEVQSLAVAPGGGILAGGHIYSMDSGSSLHDAIVWRLKPDGGDGSVNGALDRTFDGDGRVRLGAEREHETIRALARQPDGAIVAGGGIRRDSKSSAAVWRLRPDGSLDPAFGAAGTKLLPGVAAHTVGLLPDRRMLVAGTGLPDDGGYLWRLMGDPYSLAVTRAGTGQGRIVSDPAGLACETPCVGRFELGTRARLTAVPAAGSTFAGWEGEGCTGIGECAVTMDADRVVEARFDALPPAGGGGGAVVTPPLSLPAAFGPRTLVALKAGRLRRGRRLTVTVRNANVFPVTGTLAVTRPRGVRRRPLRIAANRSARVVLKLPRFKGRRLVLRATVKDPAGHTRVVRLGRSLRRGRG